MRRPDPRAGSTPQWKLTLTRGLPVTLTLWHRRPSLRVACTPLLATPASWWVPPRTLWSFRTEADGYHWSLVERLSTLGAFLAIPYLAAVACLVVSYPAIRGDALRRFYLAAELAAALVGVVSAAPWCPTLARLVAGRRPEHWPIAGSSPFSLESSPIKT